MTKDRLLAPRLALLPALAVVGVLAAGCGGSSSSSSPSNHSTMDMSTMSSSPSSSPSPSAASSSGTSSGTTAAMLTIKNFAYSGPAKVSPGAKVTVKNDDKVAHTVTADSAGGFDVNVPPGGTATFTAPGKPGHYAYHCTYHGNMHGTLTVG